MADLVVVAHTFDRNEAVLIRGLLESAGIVATLPELGFGDVDPFIRFALGGYRVMVSRTDKDAARELLQAAIDASIPAAATPLSRASWPLCFLSIVILFLTGAPIPLTARRRSD